MDTSTLYDTPPSDVTGVLDPSVGTVSGSADSSGGSNWLSTLTALTGIGTSIYGAVKAPAVATSIAANSATALSKIMPWVVGGVVIIAALFFFKRGRSN